MQYKSPSSACLGNTSFSILVGLISILDLSWVVREEKILSNDTCSGWRGWICKGQHWSYWRRTLGASPQSWQSCLCSDHRPPHHICLVPQPWSPRWCLPCHGLCGRQPCPWRGNHRWHHCWGQRRGHHPSPEYLEPTPKDQQSLKKEEIQNIFTKTEAAPT